MTTVATIIPHSQPAIDEEDLRVTAEVMRSGQIAQGPWVEQFERDMALFMGVRGGVAVSSGTAALELALRALNVGAADEVIMPSYVCAAPWLATQRVGAQARLVDIDLNTFNIDPLAACQAVTKKTRAIIVPHLFGLPADLTALEQLNIPIIEDCAQTLGATEQGRLAGCVGALTVCSFYATKLFCTGEGGMVLSNDASLLDRVRSLREYDGAASLSSGSTNCKMTDLQAALGSSQLGRLPAFLSRRSEIAMRYDRAFAGCAIRRPIVPSGRSHCYYRYAVQVPSSRSSNSTLDHWFGRAAERGIHCRKPVFRPLHDYTSLSGFPNSTEADRTTLSIPLYPAMTEEMVDQVVTGMTQVFTELEMR